MSDTKAKKTNRRFKFKLPHVYTIMFLLIVVFAVLTWIVPSGQYQRKTISTAAGEREVAVAGTYEQVDKNYTDSETGETINLGQDIFAVLQKAQEQGHPHHSHHDDVAVHLRHYVWYV